MALLLCLAAVFPAHGSGGLDGRHSGDGVGIGVEGPASGPAAESLSPGGASRTHGPVQAAWFDEAVPPRSRAFNARKAALEVGLHEAGGPARALIGPSRGGVELVDALLAVKLAPDLPLAHSTLGAVYWDDGDWLAAGRSWTAAVAAVPANLEAALWVADTLLVLAVGVLLLGSMAFIALVGLRFSAAAAHDLGDLVSPATPPFARAALLIAGVLAALVAGEGVLGAVAMLFAVGFLYGRVSHRTMLTLAAALLVLAMFPLARLAGRVLAMPLADPVASAALAVRQGVQGPGDLAVLRRAALGDDLAAVALAVDAGQRGDTAAALAGYEALVTRLPADPVVTTNLANRHFRAGQREWAVAGYRTASRTIDSPIVSFNLSQVLASRFEIEAFEAALGHAQRLEPSLVSELSQYQDPGFVADLPIALRAIAVRMFRAADGAAFARALRAPLAPGRLGEGWQLPAALLAALGLGAVVLGRRFEPAGACSRCGVRVCGRCDGSVASRSTCEGCFRIFHHPDQTDPDLRRLRLEELGRWERRRRRARRVASLTLPGVGGLLSDRPDHSLHAILCFGWVVSGLWLHAGVVPDPLVMGVMGSLLVGTTVIAAGSAYGFLTAKSARRGRSR